MEYIVTLLLGVLVGVIIKTITQKTNTIGILQIVRMEHEKPYIFLELDDGQSIESISRCKKVVFEVNDPKKPQK